MYNYLIGTVSAVDPANITLEVHGVGFSIITPYPYDYAPGDTEKVHVHHHVREDGMALYGFKREKDKQLFVQLLGVKGIGPKSALAVLASARVEEIVKAVESGDAKYLNRFPGIGPKASQQIILDLKGKIHLGPISITKTNRLLEVEDALKALGYKAKEITRVLPKLDASKDTAVLIKDALKAISR